VVDAKSSQPLFALRGVRPWAHLEFCKGFAIFDVGQGERSSHHFTTPSNIPSYFSSMTTISLHPIPISPAPS
jgi:hypothetical protein